jgi:hypothetical protein
VTLATATAKGIPPDLTRIPEGVPPRATSGILRHTGGNGGAMPKAARSGLNGLHRRLGGKPGGDTRHVRWVQNDLCNTAPTFELER